MEDDGNFAVAVEVGNKSAFAKGSLRGNQKEETLNVNFSPSVAATDESETVSEVSLTRLLSPPSADSSRSVLQAWIVESAATSHIKDIVPSATPLNHAPVFSEFVGNTVYFKREDLTPVFSFKVRGAYHKLSHLPSAALARGVSCCSAGNHAQGVAYCAKQLGVSAKIFMPRGAPQIKVASVQRFGAEIVIGGETLEDCYDACIKSNMLDGRMLVHPFDDPYIIAGSATIGLELMHQIDLRLVDYVFVGCGGGGLLAGVASVIKSIAPSVKVIGVEAAEAAGMTESLKGGHVVSLENVGRFADGASVKRVGDFSFKLCKDLVDEMVVVSTSEICTAISDAFADLRIILEPAGALAIAGVRKYVNENHLKNKVFISVCSGANVDFKMLRYIAEMADDTERVVSMLLPEHPGEFKRMFQYLKEAEVTSVSYRQSHNVESAYSNVTLCFRARSKNDADKFMGSLKEAGYGPLDCSNSPLVSFHGKYFTCGRDSVEENERMFRFEFPNRKDMLAKLLLLLNDSWNITFIHYRNYGSDMCSLLLGIDTLTEAWSSDEFESFLQTVISMGFYYTDVSRDPFISRLLPKQ